MSTHFGIGLSGETHQYVRLADTAWGNGVPEPGNAWQPRFGAYNPNLLTVSIETEDLGNGGQPVTDAQYNATLAVCRWIVAQQPSIGYLARHTTISPASRSACPGPRWVKSGRFAALAAALGLEAI